MKLSSHEMIPELTPQQPYIMATSWVNKENKKKLK